MKGDFSRDTFDPKKHFLRVMLQQGRVQLDADWNEQASILLHYIQTLAADLIGPYGGPAGNCGFKIIDNQSQIGSLNDDEKKELGIDNSGKPTVLKNGNFIIEPGRYYVDGLICENEVSVKYDEQRGYPFSDSLKIEEILNESNIMIFLDVWERHLAWCDEPKHTVPSIREVALDGPDTATRSQLIWQVKVYDPGDKKIDDCKTGIEIIESNLQPLNRGFLRASTNPKAKKTDKDYCVTTPNARYRGSENHLYRVEVHRAGVADPAAPNRATFKWSRDNGSVVFPIIEGSISIDENSNSMKATLSEIGKDDWLKLNVGNWVEFVHEDYILQNRAYPLLKVEAIDPSRMEVSLKWETTSNQPRIVVEEFKQPLLRKWDQIGNEQCHIETYGDIYISEVSKDNRSDPGKWFALEDGIQIQFLKPEMGSPIEDGFKDESQNIYRTGDYWLIPARVIGGDIEWPGSQADPLAVFPNGIHHHYAPLALKKDNSAPLELCRKCFNTMPPLTIITIEPIQIKPQPIEPVPIKQPQPIEPVPIKQPQPIEPVPIEQPRPIEPTQPQ